MDVAYAFGVSQCAANGTVHEGNNAGFPEPAGGASHGRDRVHDSPQEGGYEHHLPGLL